MGEMYVANDFQRLMMRKEVENQGEGGERRKKTRGVRRRSKRRRNRKENP